MVLILISAYYFWFLIPSKLLYDVPLSDPSNPDTVLIEVRNYQMTKMFALLAVFTSIIVTGATLYAGYKGLSDLYDEMKRCREEKKTKSVPLETLKTESKVEPEAKSEV